MSFLFFNYLYVLLSKQPFFATQLFLEHIFYNFQDLMSQFKCVVPFIPPKSRNHHDICLNKTENEMEKIMTLFVKSASNTTQGACILPCASMEVHFGVLFR